MASLNLRYATVECFCQLLQLQPWQNGVGKLQLHVRPRDRLLQADFARLFKQRSYIKTLKVGRQTSINHPTFMFQLLAVQSSSAWLLWYDLGYDPTHPPKAKWYEYVAGPLCGSSYGFWSRPIGGGLSYHMQVGKQFSFKAGSDKKDPSYGDIL